jgi:hypothetical protein
MSDKPWDSMRLGDASIGRFSTVHGPGDYGKKENIKHCFFNLFRNLGTIEFYNL